MYVCMYVMYACMYVCMYVCVCAVQPDMSKALAKCSVEDIIQQWLASINMDNIFGAEFREQQLDGVWVPPLWIYKCPRRVCVCACMDGCCVVCVHVQVWTVGVVCVHGWTDGVVSATLTFDMVAGYHSPLLSHSPLTYSPFRYWCTDGSASSASSFDSSSSSLESLVSESFSISSGMSVLHNLSRYSN